MTLIVDLKYKITWQYIIHLYNHKYIWRLLLKNTIDFLRKYISNRLYYSDAIPAETGIGGLEVARTNSRSSEFILVQHADINAVTRLLTLWSITEIISPVSTIGRGALWACPRGCHFTSNGNANSPVTFSAPVFQFSFFQGGWHGKKIIW